MPIQTIQQILDEKRVTPPVADKSRLLDVQHRTGYEFNPKSYWATIRDTASQPFYQVVALCQYFEIDITETVENTQITVENRLS